MRIDRHVLAGRGDNDEAIAVDRERNRFKRRCLGAEAVNGTIERNGETAFFERL